MKQLIKFYACIFCLFLCSCGGGSSSDSGTLIEGTLTEGGGASHVSLNLKHSEGQRIGNVEICALGNCSTTDEMGQWGVFLEETFAGGEVLLTVKGHGIDTTTEIEVPAGANEIFLDLQHVEGGRVVAEHITIDGETSHHEEGEDVHH